MRAQAQGLSSAANRDGSATRGSVFGRILSAIRASSLGSDGSGALSPRRPRIVVGLLVGMLALLAIAPSAFGYTTRPRVASFGQDGTAGTSFTDPKSLAFNQTDDTLYVMRGSSGAAIHAFDLPALTPLGGNFPVASAQSDTNSSLAVDNTALPSAGNIYYSSVDGGTRLTYGFNSAGVPLGGNFPLNPRQRDHCGLFGEFGGIAVDSAGHLWIGHAETATIREYDAAGNPLAGIGDTSAQGSPCAIAFDASDNLIVLVKSGINDYTFWKYAAPGYTTAIRFAPATSLFKSMYVDLSAGILYLLNRREALAYRTSDGALLYGFADGFSGAEYKGIAVDEGTDRVYVSESSTNKVHVFDPPVTTPDATGTTTAARSISHFRADIGGTIDDNDATPTKWRLEISSDAGLTWRTVSSGTTAGGQVGAVVSATASGLSLNSDYRFRVVTNKGGTIGSDVPSAALSFRTLSHPDATASTDPATNVTDTRADLRGTVTDNGVLPTNWRFEISDNGGSSWRTAGSGATAGGQTNAVVSTTASGLIPNTDYLFRIVTNKGAGSRDVPTLTRSFRTVAMPPVVSLVGAVDPSDTSVRLVGTIDPRHSATGYVFQYGSTPALGSSTPPLAIGDGTVPVTVSQVISGLQPDTTYYFKLVATNEYGSTASVTENVHTRADPLPNPDGRAYEQVSPVDKNFGDLTFGSRTAVAWDGDAAAFASAAGFGDPPAQINSATGDYRSARSPQGWSTRQFGEPICGADLDNSTGAIVNPQMDVNASLNLDRATFNHSEQGACAIPPLDPAAPLPSNNLYLADYTPDPIAHTLLAPETIPWAGFNENTGRFAGASDDFSHIVYGSIGPQTPDAPAQSSFCLNNSIALCNAYLFEWHNGALSLVSRDTSNNPFASRSLIAAEPRFNPVSADGGRIFFSNGTGNNQELYMREGGAVTYDVSQSECTSSCGASRADVFVTATPDGDKAFIMSGARLTDDDPTAATTCTGLQLSATACDLFSYRHSANPASDSGNLLLLSKDNEPADGSTPTAKNVLGASDDGDTVFFAAAGQLVLGAPTAIGTKIYRWTYNGGNPRVEYLMTLDESRTCSITVCDVKNHFAIESRVVTPDGRYLLVFTKVGLDPVADRDSDIDTYRWDAEGGWLCLSCQAPGAPSSGDASFANSSYFSQSGELKQVMTDDAKRVFFVSPDNLVAEDTNGPCVRLSGQDYPCQDLYEWHDGRINLISSGTGSDKVRFWGIGRDGRDVFFSTYQSLVGWDTDNLADLYDARIGGGFPEPAPQPPACEGDACRGAGTLPASIAGAGSAAFQGQGNPTSRPGNACGRISKKAQRKAKAAKQAAKRGQAKRARALRKQSRNLKRRAKRCNRRVAS